MEDIDNEPYSYVTETDIKNSFSDNQVLVLEAPLGTDLAVNTSPAIVRW